MNTGSIIELYTEEKIKETEENIIRKIKETVKYENSFAQKMDQIVNEKKGYEQNVFRYLNALIGYYGRQKEQESLETDFMPTGQMQEKGHKNLRAIISYRVKMAIRSMKKYLGL